MTQEQFVYWLQGFAELTAAAPSEEQWQSVKDHLALVFDKRTPPVRIPSSPIREIDMRPVCSVTSAPDLARSVC